MIRRAGALLAGTVLSIWLWRQLPEPPEPAGEPAASARPVPAETPAAAVGRRDPAAGEAGKPSSMAGGTASATARDFWRADDYLAFVDRHLDDALAGDPESLYFVALAQRQCVSAVASGAASDEPGSVDEHIARQPQLTDGQAALLRRRFELCAGFARTYVTPEDAEVLETAADAHLQAAADAGHPAAIVERHLWTIRSWRQGPLREPVLDDLAAAAATRHPEALRRLGDHVGGEPGIALTVLACENGLDCAPDAYWVMAYCEFPWTVCRIGASGPELLLSSLPTYSAYAVESQTDTLRDASTEGWREFFETTLPGGSGTQSEN